MKRAAALLTFASLLASAIAVTAQAAPTDYGIDSLSASLSSDQAGDHADFTTTFELKRDPGTKAPFAPTRRITFDLPPGLTGNPSAFPQCTTSQLTTSARLFPPAVKEEVCPVDSQVGVSEIEIFGLQNDPQGTFVEPVYNMVPPGGDVVARLGLVAQVIPVFIDVRLDPESGYGLTATLDSLPSAKIAAFSETTLWGDPTDPSHDPLRVTPYEAAECGGDPCTAPGEEPRESGLLPVPFISNPTSCGVSRMVTMTASSYELPAQPFELSAPLLPTVSGCGLLDFEPDIALRPTSSAADSPSGMEVELSLPQEGLKNPNLFAEAHLKKTVVTLPEGLVLNPAAAAGLGACSEAQIGLVSENPIRFNSADPTCPDSSKVGTAQIETPVLAKPIDGSLYIARQDDNPFDTLLSGYLVAQGQGVTLKLAGRFDPDSTTGRITATFDENPQAPFERATLQFKGGFRGVLITPRSCGSHAINSSLSPWSAEDPDNPTPAETVFDTDSFGIGSGPEGGPCPSNRFAPELDAGTTQPLAATYSPFVLRLHRDDGTQRLVGLSLSLPPGLVGKLAGIPPCPDAALNAAAALDRPGEGARELASPSCPTASQLGTVLAGAGAGPAPFFVRTGKVYLAGPYKGAPLSMAIVTPAVAGPFDLGSVVVRTALNVDPKTARITAVSDPLPKILHGIPLALRDVHVQIDRPEFILNPTNCEELSFAGSASSEEGATAPLSERFQIGGCRGLDFAPRLRMRLFGGTKRADYQRLRATLTAKEGHANIARAAVTLPRSGLLAQEHIKTVCTRVQFAADTCPKGSIDGRARAVTPLLDHPLTGPVYLRSSDNLLPDLVAVLRGPESQPIEIELVGRTDSFKGALRNTFDLVPDAPVSKFTLELFGGERSLIVNSENLCTGKHRATVRLKAQSGKRLTLRPVVRNSCRNKQSRKRAAGRNKG
jgi:hypothetical protein